jgi:hypothetical protein
VEGQAFGFSGFHFSAFHYGMNRISRLLFTIAIATVLLSPAALLAGPARHSLNEDAALNLLLRTIKRDHVYAKRISLDCVTFDTEETAEKYFQFALKENHTEKCGGDPDVSPVVDRYRVYRASAKIEWYQAVNDSWQRYDPARIR